MVKTNSEYRSIRKKLMAAIAMVLVASIMVVSSSYAWFTLSTAPEVKGITTSVGSNGNLEMALRTVSDVNTIQTSTGVTDTYEANAYWGNLVDLDYKKDNSNVYGMDIVSLAPARLNAEFDKDSSIEGDIVYNNVKASAADFYKVGDTYNGEKIKEVGAFTLVEGSSPAEYEGTITTTGWVDKVYKMVTSSGYLQTPDYGVEGRVSQLNANTINGIYNKDKNAFGDAGYGVRAVGTTSNISPEAMAMRNAKQTVNSAIEGAKSAGKQSMKNDAVPMANIIVQNKLNAGYSYTKTHYDSVSTAITNLTLVATSLENAMKQAVVAVGLSRGQVFTADDVTIGATDVSVKDITIEWGAGQDAEGNQWQELTAQHAELVEACKQLKVIKDALGTATTALGQVADANAPKYTELTNAMAPLLSTNDIEIHQGGKVYDMASAQTDMMALAVAMFSGSATISLKGGIYADIASFVGNFAQSGVNMTVDTKGTSYESTANQVFGKPEASVSFSMATNVAAPGAGYYLVYVSTWMSSLKVLKEGDSSLMITDTYGYVLDLAFRTNAADSGLLLQTEAADRVSDTYGEGSATMGEGSFMQFKSENVDEFTNAQVVGLMQAIRVVLTDDTGVIYGIAKMDVGLEDIMDETDESQHAAYNADVHDFYYEVVDPTTKQATRYPQKLTSGEYTDDGYVKAPLYLYSYAINDGVVTFGEEKLTGGNIMSLVQNKAHALSALVYLDGDVVDNADVAISGNSMTGKMNLQFASTATLVPMDYTFSALEKLKAPTVELGADGKTLTIGSVENATGYDIYVKIAGNDVKVGTLSNPGTFDLSTAQADNAAIPTGSYEVTVVATGGTDYAASNPSTAVTYTVS